MAEINMQVFSRNVGATVTFPAGHIVFKEGDPAGAMFVIQSGVIEMLLGDQVVDTCGPNEAIGFMSMVDGGPRRGSSADQRERQHAGCAPQ